MNSSKNQNPEVLIAGAGPTGLVLAIWLTRLGVRVRIVDKLAAPETTSRAIGVQARTLEFYRQIGFADTLIAHGRKAPATNLWVDGRNMARLPFAEMGGEISPFPFALVISQDEHELLLIEHLSQLGIRVERCTELVSFEEKNGRIVAQIKLPDGTFENCEAAWLAGCDGARSGVRETLKINFAGGTYADRFYVADVLASGPALNGEMLVALDATDFLAIFPLPGEGRARLIGTVSAEAESGIAGWKHVNKGVIESLHMKIERVNWFSTYRVHHRVAEHFRRGRIFLAGDAAHIHTPVGGQGLNTGVGDAVNLAWKLFAVICGRADAALLASYEPERIAFARKLVATTDKVFTGVTSQRAFDRWARRTLVPFVLPRVLNISHVRQFLFRTISQCGVNYRGSSLSEGKAGAIHGGDRLPWVKPDANAVGDNFSPLTSLNWQVHVYGEATAETRAICQERELPLHIFPWRPETERAGYQRDAIYLIRPDGHVALADAEDAGSTIAKHLDTHKLTQS
ncbi:MAG TPA: FAD-dependent monooxygenase [Verrucomicrobiae bacterium]|nr:FAD-dependent monooxygenase [Verrucomicrobiae bacterium]